MLLFKRLRPEARLPVRKHWDDAGLDLSACLPSGPMIIEGHCGARIPTGLAVAIPRGLEGQVRPRSSTYGRGLDAEGTVDASYRGEVFVNAWNLSRKPIAVADGERVAQLVIARVELAVPEFVLDGEELPPGEGGRGDRGFGSTGRG